MTEPILRAATTHDLAQIVEMNRAAVPAVNEIELDDLEVFHADAVRFVVVVHENALAGFAIILSTGLDYDSVNYRWFSDRYDDFWYVDRIVVSADHRGSGIGRALYDAVISEAATATTRLCAEVNLQPRNDASLAFHDRFGFTEVGRQPTEGGTKEVSLLALDLAGLGASAQPDSAALVVGEVDDLDADIATVARLLDGFSELEPTERHRMLAALEADASA